MQQFLRLSFLRGRTCSLMRGSYRAEGSSIPREGEKLGLWLVIPFLAFQTAVGCSHAASTGGAAFFYPLFSIWKSHLGNISLFSIFFQQ